jgi:hypothetical protein
MRHGVRIAALAGAVLSAAPIQALADTSPEGARSLACCLLGKGTCAPLPRWEKVDPLSLPLRAPELEALRCEIEMPKPAVGQNVKTVDLNLDSGAGPQILTYVDCPCPPRVELTVPVAKVRDALKDAPASPLRIWAAARVAAIGRPVAAWDIRTYKESILGRMPQGGGSSAAVVDRPRPPIGPTDFAPLAGGTLVFSSEVDGFAGAADRIHVKRANGSFELSRSLAWDQVPKELAVWKGKTVKVFDDLGRTCDAVVDAPMIETGGFGPSDLARKTDAEIIEHFQHIFSPLKLRWRVHLSIRPSPSSGGCALDRFARAVDRPPPRVIVASEADGALRAAAIAGLRRIPLYRGLIDNRDSMRVRGRRLGSPRFVVFDSGANRDPAVHLLSLTYEGGEDRCGLWALWEVGGTPKRPELRLLNDVDGRDVVEPLLAVDLNGDGEVELVDDHEGFIQHDIGTRYIARERRPVDKSSCHAVEGD